MKCSACRPASHKGMGDLTYRWNTYRFSKQMARSSWPHAGQQKRNNG
jgi:hypothetical protein